jgi:hypothetical protein
MELRSLAITLRSLNWKLEGSLSHFILCFQWQDRKQTLEQVDEFLTTKIAPKELGDELKVTFCIFVFYNGEAKPVVSF